MNIGDMVIYLRQQMLMMREANNRKALGELLSTFKMLTKAAYESNDIELTRILVDLTDSARELYMGRSPNGKLPSEEAIRAAMGSQVMVPEPSVAVGQAPAVAAGANLHLPLIDEPPIAEDDTQPVGVVEDETPEPPVDTKKQIAEALVAIANRDWRDHAHLRDGSPRQMQAYTVVYDKLMVFHHLGDHQPLWAGSFPIDVDIETSDIDLIFNPVGLRDFLHDVRQHYSEERDFRLTWKAINRVPTVLARFTVDDFSIELFAQPKPVKSQHAYIHMVVEARLLAIGGDDAKRAVRALKAGGMATEPAFAKHFNIEGDDPFMSLLGLKSLTDVQLMERIILQSST